MNRKVTLINRSIFTNEIIEETVLNLLKKETAPSFYLICEDVNSCKGIALTNLDKPTIIIFIQDLSQFTKTFLHELTHIQQHAKGYSDENEAEEREVVVTYPYTKSEF